MCDPVTATLVLTAVSTGVTAYGAYKQQQSTNAANKFQAQVAANNQISAEAYAKDAERRAAIEASDHKKRIAAVKADQQASIAAAGFDIGQGSALDILGDTAASGAMDLLRIKDDGARKAAQYRQQGSDFGAEAQLRANSNSSPFLAAAPSLLSGAASFSGKYADYKYLKKPTQ